MDRWMDSKTKQGNTKEFLGFLHGILTITEPYDDHNGRLMRKVLSSSSTFSQADTVQIKPVFNPKLVDPNT